MMTSAAGVMVAISGCTGILSDSDDGVPVDLLVSNQTGDEIAARIVIQDEDQETLFNEEVDLEVTDEEPSLSEQAVISGQDGQELTIRTILPDYDTEEVSTFSIDCSDELREEGTTVNDKVYVSIPSEDQIQFSHNGCA